MDDIDNKNNKDENENNDDSVSSIPIKFQNVKIALIGNSWVGKTSIIQRFATGKFKEDIKSTIGIGFTQKYLSIDGVNIQCNLWDTAGQEKYRSMGKECYKDAYIVCLVYDITNVTTFEDIKEVWLPNLLDYGEKYTVLALVGNKCDLYGDEKVNETEARDYAKSIDAAFYLTSAKDGENINELFENLVRKYLDPNFIIKINSLKEERGDSIDLKNGDKHKNKKKKCCLFN